MAQELLDRPDVPVTGISETSHANQASRTSKSIRKRLLNEVLLVGLGYLVYSQVRGLAGGRDSEAFANAHHIINIEKALGIYWELDVQRWVLPSDTLIHIFNLFYFYAFFPTIISTAVWLFWKHPEVYSIARTAFLTSGGIAVCFFLTLPTAPPRLLDVGFVDTLYLSFTPTYSEIPGVNHYAALPSMHIGWTFLIAVSIMLAIPNARFRWLAFAIPLMMFTSTVVTGNHWFLDGALGLIVAAAGLAVAFRIRRWSQRRERASIPAAG